jgi:hypothetical protein
MAGVGSGGSGCWAEIVVADNTSANVLAGSERWGRYCFCKVFGGNRPPAKGLSDDEPPRCRSGTGLSERHGAGH